MKIALVVFALCLPLWGQQQFSYVATTGNVSLTASGTAATLQQPTANGLPVMFPPAPGVGTSIYCSVACTASLIISQVAATTTVGTVNKVLPNQPTAVMNFFTASNASGGTTLAAFNIQAGQTFTLDMSAMKLDGPGSNITISIGSITGTANITFYPVEIH